MGKDKPSENPDVGYESISEGTDPRLQGVIGEIVAGKFKYSYTDFTTLKGNGVQFSISKDGTIKLTLPPGALLYKGLPDEIAISKGETFKIHRQNETQIILEVTNSEGKKDQIPFKKIEINKTPQ